MKVEIRNPSREVCRLLNALCCSWVLTEDFRYSETNDKETGEELVRIEIHGSNQDKALYIFRKWAERDRNVTVTE